MDKFDYDRMLSIQIDNGISYSPELIYHWAKKQIRELDPMSDVRDMISEMLFSYFINNTVGLNPSNKYFVHERKGSVILVRDRGENSDKRVRDYIITTSFNDVSKATKRRMSTAEMRLIDDVLTEHGINHTIRDIDQIRR